MFSPAKLTALAAIVREAQAKCLTHSVGCKAVKPVGLSVLFSGLNSKGKIQAAKWLAKELRTALLTKNLRTLQSRYIGETEKNLARIFDAGAKNGSILFFDEADALFGKRTTVKDSHDRYANQEVSYLLQRMKSYKGLTILSVNSRSSLSDAIKRRMKHKVLFPKPS
ncbi:ATP-binding protein [Candidatus Nitronereus thalassa]|uniref:ATP-binding protein n=1 Tax=Candidatus Nitronereus thalassa TaxID=3020898 RepID=A0ABU3K7X5_9BACT|nr:ATP-binding protein [Candidatus Nitronereus thalassa]MDT7042499.1 ATP-binding protein [Candidatus Nitronereus thalassa]